MSPCLDPLSSFSSQSTVADDDIKGNDDRTITTTMKKPHPQPSARAPLWDGLPPELFGAASTYLEIQDVRSLILSDPRDVNFARVVKESYLVGNFRYLRKTVLSPSNSSSSSSDPHEGMERTVRMIREWMNVNADWRDMYDESGLSLYDERTEYAYDSSEETTSWTTTGTSSAAAGTTTTTAAAAADTKDNDDDGPPHQQHHHHAQGSPFSPTNLEDRRTFDGIFNNLAVPVTCGLLEVVRHLVGVRGYDPNEESSPLPGCSLKPLLLAIQQHDPAVLKYLLEDVDNLDVNVAGNCWGTGIQLLHVCAGSNEETVPVYNMALLLRHPGVEVDARTTEGLTPLHLACSSLPDNADEKVRLLLVAGADPNATATADGETPWSSLVSATARTEAEKREIFRLLQDAGASEGEEIGTTR